MLTVVVNSCVVCILCTVYSLLLIDGGHLYFLISMKKAFFFVIGKVFILSMAKAACLCSWLMAGI